MTGALLSQIYISDLEQLTDNNAVKEPMVETFCVSTTMK